jgi:hypothetical protein
MKGVVHNLGNPSQEKKNTSSTELRAFVLLFELGAVPSELLSHSLGPPFKAVL